MFELKEVKETLEIFGNRVVRQSQNNLRRKKMIASKRLHDSIDFDIKTFKHSFLFNFKMEDYGEFQDAGVKGVGGERKYKDGKKLDTPRQWQLKRVTNNRFSFKAGIKNKPSRKHFDRWSIQKGIAPRSTLGRFQTRKSLTTGISVQVWREGLKTTNFFTDPFEKAFKELPDFLAESYGDDLDEFLKEVI